MDHYGAERSAADIESKPCQSPGRPPINMNTSSRNLDRVKKAYKAIANGNISAVLDLLDENVTWREMEGFPYAGLHRGPDAVRDNVLAKLGSEWESFKSPPEEFVDVGDTVVALGTYSGTYKKTGVSMRAPFAHVWTLEDGKVQSFRQYTDTVLVQRALEKARPKKAA